MYEARNRQGQLYLVPLTTLSLSVISKKNFTFTPHIAELAKAAATLKKVAKNLANEKGCSCVVYERRIYNEETKP